MNANEFIPLLGLTSDDDKVKSFLASCGLNKQPKLPRGQENAFLANAKLGLEFTFRDERFLPVRPKEYEEGSLVLWNIRLYGDGSDSFKRFTGELPHGLRFELSGKEARAKVGKKPAWESKDFAGMRWDFKSYCLFADFNRDFSRIVSASVQLPVP